MITYFRENTLRKQADKPTITMLNKWHQLCFTQLGENIEIMIANRHEHPRFGHLKGELNFALPNTVNDKLILGLYLENLDNIISQK